VGQHIHVDNNIDLVKILDRVFKTLLRREGEGQKTIRPIPINAERFSTDLT
jgi:hypothetical protein